MAKRQRTDDNTTDTQTPYEILKSDLYVLSWTDYYQEQQPRVHEITKVIKLLSGRREYNREIDDGDSETSGSDDARLGKYRRRANLQKRFRRTRFYTTPSEFLDFFSNAHEYLSSRLTLERFMKFKSDRIAALRHYIRECRLGYTFIAAAAVHHNKECIVEPHMLLCDDETSIGTLLGNGPKHLDVSWDAKYVADSIVESTTTLASELNDAIGKVSDSVDNAAYAK